MPGHLVSVVRLEERNIGPKDDNDKLLEVLTKLCTKQEIAGELNVDNSIFVSDLEIFSNFKILMQLLLLYTILYFKQLGLVSKRGLIK